MYQRDKEICKLLQMVVVELFCTTTFFTAETPGTQSFAGLLSILSFSCETPRSSRPCDEKVILQNSYAVENNWIFYVTPAVLVIK